MEDENQAGCSKSFGFPPFLAGEVVDVNDSYCGNDTEQQQNGELIEHQPQHLPTDGNHSGSILASPSNDQEGWISKLRFDYSTVKSDVIFWKQRVEAQQVEIKNWKKEYTQCDFKKQEEEHKNRDLKVIIKEMEQEKNLLEMTNAQSQEKIKTLESHLGEEKMQKNKLEENTALLNKEVDDLKSQLRKKNKELQNMKEICEKETDNCNLLREDLERAQNKEKKQKETLSSYKNVILNCKTTLIENLSTLIKTDLGKLEEIVAVHDEDKDVNEEKVVSATTSDKSQSQEMVVEYQEEETGLKRKTRSTSVSSSTTSSSSSVRSSQNQMEGQHLNAKGKKKGKATCNSSRSLRAHKKAQDKWQRLKYRTRANPDYFSPGFEQVGNSAGDQEGTYKDKFCAAVQSVGINNNSVDNNVGQPSSPMYEIVEIEMKYFHNNMFDLFPTIETNDFIKNKIYSIKALTQLGKNFEKRGEVVTVQDDENSGVQEEKVVRAEARAMNQSRLLNIRRIRELL
ncbi:unnamed protein product [Orchesella dallaii]|uniref:Uncharacterized protein n=1 Tax=Orchesella dallaii TaxID=48710 RepID=A0ABP1RZ75_9HEXA